MMDAETIARSLGGRRYGAGFRACCPAHSGNNPTALSIKDGNDGKILLHCYAGCDFRSIVATLRQMGLWPESTPQQRDQARIHHTHKEIEHAQTVVYIAACYLENGISLSEVDRESVKSAYQILKGVGCV